MRQQIRMTRGRDAIELAWARCGRGSPLVKTSNWLTHLQYDLESPVWRHWIDFFGRHFTLFRFDERGCGMSQRDVDDVSDANWLPDLECVIDAAGIDEPMTLLGMSQGAVTAIRYAVAHPERVARLILYGGYALGYTGRGGGQEDHYRAVMEMMRLGWGRANPVFRQAFAGRFIPQGSHEQLDWFNELCRVTAEPDMAVRLLEARGTIDITDLVPRLRVPTLVLHARDDEVVPFREGRRLAAEIPGAEFVALESCNHILLPDEPAWPAFQRAVLEFCGLEVEQSGAAMSSLTGRESEVLELLCKGWSNARIAASLSISEKTVRNHLSHLYRKLGVRSRTEAIVEAHRYERA